MTGRVLLTVDTELAWRHYQAGLGWEENYARSVEPAGVGLAYQLDRLARHGLKACFFVDPMPACRYGLEPVRRMVGAILEAGQEVQLHLHPSWLVRGGEPTFELTGLDEDEQRALIATARRLLIEAGAPPPIAFRAGSFGADDATLRALAGLGFRFDSSFNAGHSPWPSAISLPPWQVDPILYQGIVECPVSQLDERDGWMRHLQLCAVSFAELRASLAAASAAGQPLVTIVSHSFELASRDGLKANRIVGRRFERLCAWLGGNRDRLETAHFADLAGIRTDRRSPLPRPGNWRRFERLAEQALGNLLYEGRL
ncbi:MAG: polysaccharide deacetylase [Alphaproteobacteria bacterium]|nr:polysaccharide deacetylase [Alphaproteobacteria bacterium]MBV9372749.1 polysaccharide deacetylase [Alphaproteobacteria bacterium]MBV9900902.1 polysaccharide deacetylase [Alphaproteobacteria bacterium]